MTAHCFCMFHLCCRSLLAWSSVESAAWFGRPRVSAWSSVATRPSAWSDPSCPAAPARYPNRSHRPPLLPKQQLDLSRNSLHKFVVKLRKICNFSQASDTADCHWYLILVVEILIGAWIKSTAVFFSWYFFAAPWKFMASVLIGDEGLDSDGSHGAFLPIPTVHHCSCQTGLSLPELLLPESSARKWLPSVTTIIYSNWFWLVTQV